MSKPPIRLTATGELDPPQPPQHITVNNQETTGGVMAGCGIMVFFLTVSMLLVYLVLFRLSDLVIMIRGHQ